MWLVYVFCPVGPKISQDARVFQKCTSVCMKQDLHKYEILAQMWNLPRCETCTDVKLAQRWDLHRCGTCTDVKLAQMWSFHRCETCTKMRLWLRCEEPFAKYIYISETLLVRYFPKISPTSESLIQQIPTITMKKTISERCTLLSRLRYQKHGNYT